jgi:PIN domain nuclease of toxin-antitoxin system
VRLLLDTHILLALLKETLSTVAPAMAAAQAQPGVDVSVSACSLREIGIKTRLGKLEPGLALDHLPHAIDAMGFSVLPITASHALAAVEPVPPTRDPFDRLLLAQCIVEGRRLVTRDHALAGHPFAANFSGPT